MSINNKKPFLLTFITLYPEMFPGILQYAVSGRGYNNNIWDIKIINIRDFGLGKHKQVDDYIYGGSKGMLLRPDVLSEAIEHAFEIGASRNLVYANPKGKVLNNELSKEFSYLDGLTFICGHFEGIDQRLLDVYKPTEVSIGDYILSGGELSSIVIADSTLRFLPNMLNSYDCVEHESFSNGLLEHPHYTKPYDWNGNKVPSILLSGNHQEIAKWKVAKSEEITKITRSDLWSKYKEIKKD